MTKLPLFPGSLIENIDTTSPGGRRIFHLFAALAEFERDLIRERTRAGLTAARARGRQGGRPSSLTDDQALTARRFEQKDMTVAQIGKVLGVSRSTVYSSTEYWVTAPRRRCHSAPRRPRNRTNDFKVLVLLRRL